jgi:uncharacterized membrane protein YdjX (TVP38/TMEM64 family)
MARMIKRLTIFAALLALFLFLGHFYSRNTAAIEAYFSRIPLLYSSCVFVLLYVIANFFIFWDIKDVLKLIGAVIFGAYISTGLIFIAEVINAALFFNISHILGKDFVEKSLRGKFKNLYEKMGNLSFTWIFLIRLLPLIPYRVLDVSFGLSKVRFRTYMAAVLLASLPRIFVIQFPLAAVKEMSFAKMSAYFNNHPLILWLLFFYYIISFLIAFQLKKRLR